MHRKLLIALLAAALPLSVALAQNAPMTAIGDGEGALDIIA
jgi:hypothetical protein